MNEKVRRQIQAAVGGYDELETETKWFGHALRSFGLAETILRGSIKGKRKRGK